MITQQEFVEGCQRYYAENWLEPGNPEDGEWNDCHYPAPSCLGGTETVKLLKEHHAVQGVLQSEEFGHPCILGWEANYLSGELYLLCKKWTSELGRYARKKWMEKTTYTERQDRGRKARATQVANTSPEVLRDIALKAWETKRKKKQSG